MIKEKLIEKFYSKDSYDSMTVDELTVLAHFYEVDLYCIIATPIYQYMIKDDICDSLNKLYKSMTTKNIITENMNYREIEDKFEEIKVEIRFL